MGVSGTQRVRDERHELLSLVSQALAEQTGEQLEGVRISGGMCGTSLHSARCNKSAGTTQFLCRVETLTNPYSSGLLAFVVLRYPSEKAHGRFHG